MAIWFHSEYPGFHLRNKRRLKKWIYSVIQNNGFTIGTINYSFLNDEELLGMNIKFLNHDFYTDIISFDYSEHNIIAGDIYISIDRLIENSKEFNCAFENEMERVIIHGILHFLGYKDKSKPESLKMRQAESTCLAILNSTK